MLLNTDGGPGREAHHEGGMMAKDAPHYEIRTVDDFLAVPADRLAACLEEFAGALEGHRLLAAAVLAAAESLGIPTPADVVTMSCFAWTDDGGRTTRVHFEGRD